MAKKKETPFAWNEAIQKMNEEGMFKAGSENKVGENNDMDGKRELIALINKVREYELATHWGVNLNFDKPNQKTPNEYRQEGINIMADALIKALS